jgi:hypothetical protein
MRAALRAVLRKRPFAQRDKKRFASLENNNFAKSFLMHMGITKADERAKFWSDNNEQVFFEYRTLFNLVPAGFKKGLKLRQSEWNAAPDQISRDDPENFELFTDVMIQALKLEVGVSLLSQATLSEEALARACIHIIRKALPFHTGKGPSSMPSVDLVTSFNTNLVLIKAERKKAMEGGTAGIDDEIAAKSVSASVEPLSESDDDNAGGKIILRLQRSIRRDFCTQNRPAAGAVPAGAVLGSGRRR